MRLCLSADLQPLAAQVQAVPSENKLFQRVLSPDSSSGEPGLDQIRPGVLAPRESCGTIPRLHLKKSGKTMRPMAICPECYPCLERLVGLAVELATPDPEVRRQALKSARRRLDQEFGPDAIPAAIANRLLRPLSITSPGTMIPSRPGKPRRPPWRPGCTSVWPRLTATTWNPSSAWPRWAMPWIFSGEKRKWPGRCWPGWSSGSMRCLTFARNWPALPV